MERELKQKKTVKSKIDSLKSLKKPINLVIFLFSSILFYEK